MAIAQAKFIHPKEGSVLRDLRNKPGIFCNGALVKGVGGKEVLARSLGDCTNPSGNKNFVDAMLDKWMAALSCADPPAAPHVGDPAAERIFTDCCLIGLAKEQCLLLDDERYAAVAGSLAPRAGSEFLERMEITGADFKWINATEFRSRAPEVMSFLMLMPKSVVPPDASSEQADKAMKRMLMDVQSWLDKSGLLSFDDASRSLSNGTPSADFSVVCKHVHVPGIGPEVDISPVGINKGSAIVAFLEAEFGSRVVPNSAMAVFGDAGNDVELFGMKRTVDGSTLEPLFADSGSGSYSAYRPSMRVSMPWANDALLMADATVQARAHVVLEKIVQDKQCGR